MVLQLGEKSEALAAVLTLLRQMKASHVLLSVPHQVPAVAALVDDGEVLGQTSPLVHLQAELTADPHILAGGSLDGPLVSPGCHSLHAFLSSIIFLKQCGSNHHLLTFSSFRTLFADKMLIVQLRTFELIRAVLAIYSDGGHRSRS